MPSFNIGDIVEHKYGGKFKITKLLDKSTVEIQKIYKSGKLRKAKRLASVHDLKK